MSIPIVLPSPTIALTPTAQYYFARSHAAEIARGTLDDGTPLVPHAGAVFALGEEFDRWIVLRDASDEMVRFILDGSPERLAVVVDDDGEAIARDPSQPLAYRWRQWRAHRRRMALLQRATHALAPSAALLARLRGWAPRAEHRSIAPALDPVTLPALDHHAGDGPITMLISDTRSHLSDIAAVATAVREALDTEPRLRLVTYLGRRAPTPLRHERAEHREPLPWAKFAAEQASLRAHILLAPRRATPVNAARSSTRVLEAATAGAIGLYGHVPAIAVAARGTLPDWTHGEVDWRAAIARLVNDPAERLRLAERTAELARRIGDMESQRALWREVLS